MKRLMSCAALAGLCVAALFVVAGCETEPAGDELISITPISTKLREGETQTFEASGAKSYKWSLKTTETTVTAAGTYGYLSALSGATVVYTSTYAASNVVADILTVSGVIDPSSTTGVYTAQASIIHLGADQ